MKRDKKLGISSDFSTSRKYLISFRDSISLPSLYLFHTSLSVADVRTNKTNVLKFVKCNWC